MFYKATGIAPLFHRRAQRLDVSLVHAHFAADGGIALAVASAIQKPMVVTLHGIDVTATDDFYQRTAGGRIYLARRRRLWREANLFLCVSDYLHQKAIRAGFPENKLRTHYIGIDLTLFRSPASDQPRKDVLFVGRLVEKKGCRYLVDAMREVQARWPLAKLIVIGDGPERAALEKQATELGVTAFFRGAQPAAAIRSALASARVFCAPSITGSTGDSEGLGIVFAEAQAMGVPVVSSAHGGIPEVVCDGRTGLLAPERDHKSLAECIIRLLADEELWRRLSSQAIAWVPERFDVRRQTVKLESVYDSIIRERAVH